MRQLKRGQSLAVLSIVLLIASGAAALPLAQPHSGSADRVSAADSTGTAASAAGTNIGASKSITLMFDPALDEQLSTAEMTTVIVRLNTEFTGNDAERTAAASAAVARLLSTLPEGSYSDIGESGVLPVATFRASRAAVDVLRSSPLVRAVGADEPLELASENAQFRDGAAKSNASGSKGGGTTVAVIDSGVDSTHPYLMNGTTKKVIAEGCFTSAIPSQNFLSPCPGGAPMSITSPSVVGSGGACPFSTSPYNDTSGGCDHGTHVAGIIAGQPGTPGFGELSGVAPNTKLIAVQVFGFKSDLRIVTSLTSDVLNALKWLYNRRADFPNLSAVNISIASTTKRFASSCDTDDAAQQAMFAAVQALRDVGIATITAAGNSGWNDGISSPACLSNTIGVGAIDDATGARASFSNLSNLIALYAPGASIQSAYPNFPATPRMESGTSQATPAVAGAWALMRQKFPVTAASAKSVTEILAMLRSTGTTVSTTVTIPSTTIPVGPASTVTYTAPTVNINRALGIPSPLRVAIGGDFSCARDSNNTVTCSGANASGQLGISPTTVASVTTPRRIDGLTGVGDIVVGVNFACAKTGSSLKCWGSNISGQLGIGTTSVAPSSGPTTVKASATADLSGVNSVSAGASTACAVIGIGPTSTVNCWGANQYGQLGDGTTTKRSYPTTVKANPTAPLTGVRSVEVGQFSTCVVMNSGAVYCWGNNSNGELGTNTTTASTYPVAVTGIDGRAVKAKSVSVGAGFACAVLTTGSVKCWGRNPSGQLGNNTTRSSLTPVDVVTTSAPANSSATTTPSVLTGVVSISAGWNHSRAIAIVGGISKVFCWGANSSRQLGVGTNARWFAAAVFGTKTDLAISVSTGPASTAVVVTNATAVIGVNTTGELGLGDLVDRTTMSWSLRF
jgi:alpha-tubulin suppressor-like RCC1 family protein/subtilisin family serine protease